MRKILLFLICFCFLTSMVLGDGNVPLERRNYIVEKQNHPTYIIPSLMFAGGAYWLWVESDKTENEDDQWGIKIMSGCFAFISLVFFGCALTPTKTFWFPKLGEDGKTIWFEKEITRW